MTLKELELIEKLITIHSDARLHKTYDDAVRFIRREIKLKVIDPVTGRRMNDVSKNQTDGS